VKRKLYDFNNQHIGETIYVIGSSPSLNNLTQEELEFLEDKTTIGVNFTYEAVNSLTYAISAHISPAVYLFEYANKEMPIFVAFNEGVKKRAFSYMQDFFWDDDRIVTFSSDAPSLPLYKKQNENDISLSGNTSILLLATHLACIMGAAKIVYIGFEELVRAHFWDERRETENKMVKNMRDLLANKKYWSSVPHSSDKSDIPYNVHKEFEEILGDLYRHGAVFNLTEEERANSFYINREENQRQLIKQSNSQFFAAYVDSLNKSGIQIQTLSNEGITVQSGCQMIKSVIE